MKKAGSAMLVNLHTHTPRCGHAFGSEREFIETAISRGIKTLGFSDHAPMLFPDGYYSTRVRMRPEELEDYVKTLLALREEYRGVIDLLIGLEMEYYPSLFDKTLAFFSQYPVDYLILGQHYLGDEMDRPNHTMTGSDDPADLSLYVDQCCAGLETGRFTYLAHPDAFLFQGDPGLYDREMERLCRKALELCVPLEINMYGVVKGGHYPSDRFWHIASQVGNEVLIGCDAHKTEMLLNDDAYAKALAMAERNSITLIEMPELRRPF